MTREPRLLVPLDLLPGPAPAGAPKFFCPGCVCPPGTHFHGPCACGARGAKQVLDLSPPPTNADGWPTHIDGADVAAGMLAAAMTDGACHSASFYYSVKRGGWTLDLGDGSYIVNMWGSAADDIDPADPLAPRLALAAVLRVRPWRNR